MRETSGPVPAAERLDGLPANLAHVFVFITNRAVPYTNNASKRHLRPSVSNYQESHRSQSFTECTQSLTKYILLPLRADVPVEATGMARS